MLSEPELGASLDARFIDPVASLGEFGDVLIATIATFVDHGLRVEETAASLHVHSNTLRNRILRYEELCDADMRNMEDLVSIWWCMSRRQREG